MPPREVAKVRGRGRRGASSESVPASLSERLDAIERRLASPRDPTRGLEFSDDALAGVATRMFNARRRRAQFFDPELLSDPAWDMLLDLFIARIRGKWMRTISLCIASGVPNSTALRWIAALEAHDLIERRGEHDDRRVRLIALSDRGYRLMRQYLTAGSDANELPVAGGPGERR